MKDDFLLKQHPSVHHVLGVFLPPSLTPTPGTCDTKMRKVAVRERCDLADSWVFLVGSDLFSETCTIMFAALHTDSSGILGTCLHEGAME